MPTWEGRLDPATVNALTVYVHTLGGGRDGSGEHVMPEVTGSRGTGAGPYLRAKQALRHLFPV